MIALEGVCFGYVSGSEVLSDLDLVLEPGLCLLLGPNGCGKSSLLKVVAGVEHPSSGRVRVAGHDLWRDEVAARRHLAYQPEHPDLSPYATLNEVLALVSGLRGQPPEAAATALEWAGLTGLGLRTVRELSRGQRRRATMAAASIGTPSCLLLDEPLDGMDRAFRSEVERWLGELLSAGALALVVSHDLEPFAELADTVITVRNGRCHVIDPLPPMGPKRMEVLEALARGQ